jgi:hypothetical protein
MALVLCLLHTFAVWGYTGVWWGDHGRWLHEVDRFASGEIPYRDFYWHFPPLSLWIVGGAARIVGTSLAAVSTITASLMLVLVGSVVAFHRALRDRHDDWALVGVSLLFAFAYAFIVGAPLPLGTYVPAALIGVILIAMSVLTLLTSFSGRPRTLALGLFAGLAILTKQDFWLPAVYVLVVHAVRHRTPRAPLIAGGVVVAGAAVVAATAGWRVLGPLVGGFGIAATLGGRGYPSWERLTLEVLVVAFELSCVVLIQGVVSGGLPRRRLAWLVGLLAIAVSVYLVATISSAQPAPGALQTAHQSTLAFHGTGARALLRPALGLMRRRIAQDPIPFILPVVLLLLIVRRWSAWSDPALRNRVALLLGFAITLRVRRGFEATEWFEWLLVLPVLLLTMELFQQELSESQRRHCRTVVLSVLGMFSVVAYHQYAKGFGTKTVYAPVRTERGIVRWSAGSTSIYVELQRQLRQVDSAGRRPLYAFGYTGGVNYFLRRTNPYPFTETMRFSSASVDSVLRGPIRGLLLVDNSRFFLSATNPSMTLSFDSWEQPVVLSHYARVDAPQFERLRIPCHVVDTAARVAFRVLACP